MVYISRPYPFIFFKGCLPYILLCPFLNTLSQMFLTDYIHTRLPESELTKSFNVESFLKCMVSKIFFREIKVTDSNNASCFTESCNGILGCLHCDKPICYYGKTASPKPTLRECFELHWTFTCMYLKNFLSEAVVQGLQLY